MTYSTHVQAVTREREMWPTAHMSKPSPERGRCDLQHTCPSRHQRERERERERCGIQHTCPSRHQREGDVAYSTHVQAVTRERERERCGIQHTCLSRHQRDVAYSRHVQAVIREMWPTADMSKPSPERFDLHQTCPSQTNWHLLYHLHITTLFYLLNQRIMFITDNRTLTSNLYIVSITKNLSIHHSP